MTEGERWARKALTELRAARFTPRAWLRFLARSFDRANERRRDRARAFRQVLLVGGAGFCAWGGLAAAGRPGLAAVGAVWWLALVLMLDWHLGMLERPDGRPLDGLGIANVLTALRAGLVPALPALSPAALAVALGAAQVTDVLDGQLARRRDESTRLGLWLDGSVDTLLLSVAAVSAGRLGLVPGWVVALVVARYALPWVLVGSAYFGRAAAPPREGYVSGRLPGFLVMAGLAVAAASGPVGAALAAAGALSGTATFGASVVRSIRLARS